MATTTRSKLNIRRQLPYTFAGDPQERGFQTSGAAIGAAQYFAERHPDDGEEYRHGIFDLDRKVAVVVRQTNGHVVTQVIERQA